MTKKLIDPDKFETEVITPLTRIWTHSAGNDDEYSQGLRQGLAYVQAWANDGKADSDVDVPEPKNSDKLRDLPVGSVLQVDDEQVRWFKGLSKNWVCDSNRAGHPDEWFDSFKEVTVVYTP